MLPISGERIGALPGFGAMKITGLGSVLALQFGVEAAQELVPEHPCLGRIDSPEALAEYQAAKRAHKAALARRRSDGVTESAAGAAPRPAIAIETLTDGGQRPADVARGIARFLAEATETLDLALYDVRFETDAGALVLASLLAAVQRGVAVRLLYNVDHPGPDPGAASTRDGAAGDRGAPDHDARASPVSPTSCTTSSSSATARRSGAARRTGRTTRGRDRRTSS